MKDNIHSARFGIIWIIQAVLLIKNYDASCGMSLKQQLSLYSDIWNLISALLTSFSLLLHLPTQKKRERENCHSMNEDALNYSRMVRQQGVRNETTAKTYSQIVIRLCECGQQILPKTNSWTVEVMIIDEQYCGQRHYYG